AGAWDRRVSLTSADSPRERQPVGRRGKPAETESSEPGRRLGAVRRLDLRGRQQVSERIEVVADADATLGARLEGGRPTSAERVEDDVPAPAVAPDEGMGEGRWEARQVGAHRMERRAPQTLLVLPLRGDPDVGERGRRGGFEREGELGRGRGPAVDRHPGRWLLTVTGRGAYHAISSVQAAITRFRPARLAMTRPTSERATMSAKRS